MFEVHHHARMLADRHRTDAFADALEALVRPEDCVVDVGAGTGILAAMAAERTIGPVFAFEYLERTASFAREAVEKSGLTTIHVANENFLAATIPQAPDVLVTETIGALGPEENIVELTHHAQQRYPTLRDIIPSELTLKAVPITSSTCTRIRAAIHRSYENAGTLSTLRFTDLKTRIDEELGRSAHTANLSDATTLADPLTLVTYDLGRSFNADFTTKPFPVPSAAEAVHLYFEAQLAPETTLSSHLHAPATHWSHSFVLRPPNSNTLAVGYGSSSRTFTFDWAA